MYAYVNTRAGPLEWRDIWERTPLHWAVINGHATAVSFLLREGADTKAKDKVRSCMHRVLRVHGFEKALYVVIISWREQIPKLKIRDVLSLKSPS
jgi:hypothetical protein